MRFVLVLGLLCGCADSSSSPTPERPSSCPRACTPDDADCGTFSADKLPARCQDICHLGSCCDLVDGAWQTTSYDCARGSGA